MELENCYFIISIDIDVGNKKLGQINKGKNNINVSSTKTEYEIGFIEELGFPLFLELFEKFEIPVTFAIRGQLLELNNTIFDLIRHSSIEHDIGAHGYFHKQFTTLNKAEAKTELKLINNIMKKRGIKPRSFIFPRNSVSHLDLLEKFHYICYRDKGNFRNNGMYIVKRGNLYDVHPSLYLDKTPNIFLLKNIINIPINKKLPFHIWFHLWNFGNSVISFKKNIKNVLYPLLKYVKEKEEKNLLTFETMFSATQKIITKKYDALYEKRARNI